MHKARGRKLESECNQLTVVANFDFCCRCACNAVWPLLTRLLSCCVDTFSSLPKICRPHHTCTKWSPSERPVSTSSISPNLYSAIQIVSRFMAQLDPNFRWESNPYESNLPDESRKGTAAEGNLPNITSLAWTTGQV